MKRRDFSKNTRGAIMLEALIVYPITIFLLFFILATFSVLFQRWNIQTIANEAVGRMAQTYRLPQADESSGFVTEEQIVDVGAYRYAGNLFTKNMEKSIKDRIANYASWRLAQTTYTKSVTAPECEVEVHSDALGRRHLKLTITGEYSVPFGEILTFFGFGGTITYSTTAYADCVDIIDYINLVDYVDYQTKLNQFGSKTIGLVDAFLGMIDNILDH